MQNIGPRGKDQLKELVAERITNLEGHFKSPKCKVLNEPDVQDTPHELCTNYILVPSDKAANNVIVSSATWTVSIRQPHQYA